MKHVEQYYRNLCEQLQEKINLLEKKIEKKKKEAKEKFKAKKKGKEKEELADKDYDGDGKLETGKEEHAGSVDKAIKKNIALKKKTGKVISESFVYGGFPRVKNLNEEMNPRQQLEVHMETLGKFGQELHRTDHPNRYKYGKLWAEFSQGNYNNADELIKLGADPEAVGNYIKIATSPEFKAHQKEVQSKITPEQMGYNRKDNWTGD